MLPPSKAVSAMTQPSQSFVRNCLLSALSGEAYDRLQPHLEFITLEKGQVLIEADRPFGHVHFPERGIGSMIVSTPDSRRVETGIFGRDGMSGVGAVLGPPRMPQTCVMQVAGDGYRVEVGAFQSALAESAALRDTMLRYAQVMLTQASFTALSNASQTVEERLARWLLMCHDRIEGDEIALTHEFLSIMLAVHRPSVTTALHLIEGNGFIRATRGKITVLDREGLVAFSDGAYGTPEAEYRRLIGTFA